MWPEDEAVAEKPEVEILPKEPEVEEVLPEVVSNTVSMETIVDSEPKLPENEVCDEEMRVFDSDLEEDEHEEAETCVGTLQKWDTDARLHSLSTVAADDDEELTNLEFVNIEILILCSVSKCPFITRLSILHYFY